MPVHNADIAAIFEEIAVLLEIESDNPLRVRHYVAHDGHIWSGLQARFGLPGSKRC